MRSDMNNECVAWVDDFFEIREDPVDISPCRASVKLAKPKISWKLSRMKTSP